MKNICGRLGMVVLIFQIISCTDQYTICNQTKIANLNMAFFTIIPSGESATAPASLTLNVLNSPNFIYKQKPLVSVVNTGLNPLYDSIVYFIKLSDPAPADTIKLKYSNRNQFLSAECGEIPVYDIISATTTANNIDSIKIVQAAVLNQNQKNLKIYF